MLQDSISDMLTRIRNASKVKKHEVCIPFSKVKWGIAKILKENGYIGEFVKSKSLLSKKGKGTAFDEIIIQLVYCENKTDEKILTSLKRISKPGRRVYVNKENLPVVLNHFGIAIISTPQGLMTNKQAKRLGLGGEVICEIY